MKVSLLRRCWVTLSAWVIGTYASLLNKFRIEGASHLPASGGVLIVSNHISAYDTVFLPWAVIRTYPLQMLWAPAKEELFRNPFLAWLFRSWGAFSVRRGRDVRAGKHLNELLADQKVMLFPEGTRHKDGKLGPGNRGVGKIIYDVRPAVVPAGLSGINTWRFPSFGARGRVRFGAPLHFDDLFQLPDCKETHQQIVDRVMKAIAVQIQGGNDAR
ncbi:lysophospholipid acyltransferase family protein [Geomesophilobacter sediminis]|uniref:1-acyl-sn-glycerol-3-phosphate acyltransferase n=1 Tax=Geomesophilobacter sediminis TaxID=2798584 RepID=A0A8J7J584_9BACT|nr:lysophospholipid acyltransferase family protein [Geomesophilobacter sediminis]MBJ6723536.1 1-acyl-sn-glycerol-3-phosphate acyltransferase [Geomesophilobacter sediminis]